MTETQAKAENNNGGRGGRKGGTPFPRINLADAVKYAKKLVSKTHTGAQAEKTILPGVFGNTGSNGRIRASALKHYKLLEGPVTAYKATDLAKAIDAAPEEELPPLLQQAFLNAKVFKKIFDTFHGDTISKAKLEQQAKTLCIPKPRRNALDSSCNHLSRRNWVASSVNHLYLYRRDRS